jgi:AraC-like DNA-binding protein
MPRKIELSAAYARLALQSGVASAAELLRDLPITEASLAEMEFIDASTLAVLFQHYDQHAKDRAWTARIGSQFNIGAHGPLGFAALSAPTLGEAMDVMGTLYESRTTAMIARAYATQSHYVLQIEDISGEPAFSHWHVEVILKIMEMLLSSILGHRVGTNVVITFTHSAPEEPLTLTSGYDSHIVFDADENSIAVPLAWRHLPSPLHDESVYRANVIKCRELIAAREQMGSIALSVRNRLSNHFDSQLLHCGQNNTPPTLDDVAATLHLTSRTLMRRLREENTAYKELLESLRREYAERLLQDARLNIADVAAILGYQEAANFTRAFKRWHGVSPAVWRRR